VGTEDPPTLQAIFSVVIFVLLSSQDGFSTETGPDGRKPALYNGIFSTIAFLVHLPCLFPDQA